VVVIFEDEMRRKGGTISGSLNRSIARLPRCALSVPTTREDAMVFPAVRDALPAAANLLFDRSGTTALVSSMSWLLHRDEYHEFCARARIRAHAGSSGIILIKYWFSVSDEAGAPLLTNGGSTGLEAQPIDWSPRRWWSFPKQGRHVASPIKAASWYVVGPIQERAALTASPTC